MGRATLVEDEASILAAPLKAQENDKTKSG
jgi:hypothetical protein